MDRTPTTRKSCLLYGNILIDKVSLYPPGKIVHLVKTSENLQSLPHKFMKFISCGMSNVGSEYTPMYVGVFSHTQDFHEIVVSPTRTMWVGVGR